MFDLGIAAAVWPWLWLGVAVLFIVVELTVLGGSMVVLPFGVSALVASVLAFYRAPLAIQLVVFVVGGLALFGVFARWASLLHAADPLPPGVGADRLVGLTATVVADVAGADADRLGRVEVVGETWGAFTADEHRIPVGARVTIVAMEGTRVCVTPMDSDTTEASNGPGSPLPRDIPPAPPGPPSQPRDLQSRPDQGAQ